MRKLETQKTKTVEKKSCKKQQKAIRGKFRVRGTERFRSAPWGRCSDTED